MSRLFTLLCLALFTLAAPACDDEEPKDSSTTDASSSSGSDGTDSTGDSRGLAPGDATGDSETTEDPGTATLATPHISTG
jgi:hypothetical protein